jgi:hypothetical protein
MVIGSIRYIYTIGISGMIGVFAVTSVGPAPDRLISIGAGNLIPIDITGREA